MASELKERGDIEKRGHSPNPSRDEKLADGSDSSTPSPDAINDATLVFPDGSFRGWLNVFGTWLVMFSTFGYIFAFGVYQDFYTRTFITNRTASEISWIGSAQICLVFSLGMFSGAMFDKGYFHQLMICGTLIYVFSQMMLSLVKPNSYYQVFLSQGIGVGLGLGLLFLPPLTLLTHWFRRRPALAFGLALSGTSSGGLVFPVLLNKLFQNPKVGFAWGVRVAAFIILVLLVIANLVLKTRLPSAKEREAMGMPKRRKIEVGPILRDVPYMLATFGVTLIAWGLFFPVFYIQLFSIQHDINPTLSFYALSVMNASGILGRTLPNFVADSYGPLNCMIICSFVSGLTILIMFVAAEGLKVTWGGVVGFGVVFGFTSGAYLSILPPMITSLTPTMEEIGIRSGLTVFCISWAALTGTPISGALLGGAYQWWKPAVFSAAVVFAGSSVLVWTRAYAVRKKATQFV